MENNFDFDFSNVRIHENSTSEKVARDINARAFTYRNNIYLGKGESSNDYSLISHEIAHVTQQNKKPNLNTIQRRVTVLPNTAAVNDIMNQMQTMCPNMTLTNTGLDINGNMTQSTTQTAAWLDNAINSTSRTFTIQVDKVSNAPRNVTLHNGTNTTIPYPSSGPRTINGTNPRIYMPASSGSAIEFGAFNRSGNAEWAPNWRILGHELLGHGLQNQSYAGIKGNRPGHNITIDTENQVASDVGVGTQRGKFNDVNQGESFHNPTGNRSMIAYMLINGWHYQPP